MLALFACGCGEQVNTIHLEGSWRMRDLEKSPGMENVTDRATFTKDSMIGEVLQNDSVVQRVTCAYKVDPTSKLLTLFMPDTQEVLEIVRLDASEMELRRPSTGLITVFVRY